MITFQILTIRSKFLISKENNRFPINDLVNKMASRLDLKLCLQFISTGKFKHSELNEILKGKQLNLNIQTKA